jgi:hypothetical protein
MNRYDGLLPEGTVGHTTEVREQLMVHGPLLDVTLVLAPYAPTAAAHAKLRAVLLAREAASPAKRPDYDKALAALTGDDTGDDDGASGDLDDCASGGVDDRPSGGFERHPSGCVDDRPSGRVDDIPSGGD